MDDPVVSQLQKSFSKACGSVASCLTFKCSLRHPEEETARLWSLLALRLVTCPYLSHILRPPCRRLHLVVHHILALRSREALLDNFLHNLLQRSSPFRLYSGKKGDSRFQKKSSATPHNGEVVGSKSLVPLWRSATAWSTPGWLGGLWGGLLDSGDSAGWLSDPLRPSTSSIRAASLSLLAYSRQPIKVVALIQDLQTPLRKGAVEPAPQSPCFYNSLFLIQKASGSWHPIIDFSP